MKTLLSLAGFELDTDVVVPTLLSGPEAHLSREHSRLTPPRGQRSVNVSGGLHSGPQDILVALPAFGRHLVLNLTRDTSFLSGDFVVEERRAEQSTEMQRVPQLCFYSGYVVNQSGSVASLSTCGGLVSPLILQPHLCSSVSSSRSFWSATE